MKFATLMVWIAMGIGMFACNSDNILTSSTGSETNTLLFQTEDIPLLLDRHESLWYGKEWELTQNSYGTCRQKILSGTEVNKNILNLVQLFMVEARITGEHGHYYPSAFKLINRTLENDVIDNDLIFRLLMSKGSILLSQHEFSDALEIGQRAVSINPYNAQAFGILVDACVELGQYEKAVEMADKMVSIRPDLRSYSRISYLREIHGMEESAIEAMELAVSAGFPGTEETAWTRLQLGNLYEKTGRNKEAEYHYNRILIERPDYPFALAALASLKAKKGQFNQAENYLKKACDIIPEVGFYEQLATIYLKSDRKDEASYLIDTILEMLQDDIESGHNMNLEYANVYMELLGDYETALQYAIKEYRKRPANIEVNILLASIYRELGEAQLAEKHLADGNILAAL